MLVLILTAAIVLAVLFIALDLFDPVLTRLHEINTCLARLDSIRKCEKDMHDLAYQWQMQDLKERHDEMIAAYQARLEAEHEMQKARMQQATGETTH